MRNLADDFSIKLNDSFAKVFRENTPCSVGLFDFPTSRPVQEYVKLIEIEI